MLPPSPEPARPSFGLRILARRLPSRIRACEPTRVDVLLDRRAAPAVRAELEAALATLAVPQRIHLVTATEPRKSLSEIERLASRLVRAGADRSSLLLGVGGGITTDLCGFLAATLMRGCAWGAVPTTLLGMADAALGGKTAVNLPEGKNLLGAFHQPRFVIADLATLRTLPPREWSCGLGEVLKSGMIGSPTILRRIAATLPRALRRPGSETLALAKGAASVKMKIVTADPFEGGPRKLLNLGHTFGHALETAAGPRRLAHGEAVGLGLLCALRLAVDEGRARPAYAAQILQALDRCGLPTRYPGRLPGTVELTRLIARDKKKAGATVDVVLPLRPGRCEVVPGRAPRELAEVVTRTLG